MAYRLPASVMRQEVDGETVLLQLDTEQYHQLDAMGTEMLALLLDHSEEATAALLLERYDVSESRLRTDLGSFVEGMMHRGLLEPDR